MIQGRRRELGLGGFPLVSLAEARAKAFAYRKIAREGGDPLTEKRRADGIPTFAEAAERVWKGKNPGWRQPGREALFDNAPAAPLAEPEDRGRATRVPFEFPRLGG